MRAKKLKKRRKIKLNKLLANKRKFARNQIAYVPHLKYYLENIPKLLTTTLGTSPPRNMITQQPAQVLLTTEIGGSVKFSVGIAYPFRTHRSSLNKQTIYPSLV